MAAGNVVLAVLVALFAGIAQVHSVTDDVTTYQLLNATVPLGIERALCLVLGECSLKTLTCPEACPKRDSLGFGRSACFINCKSCTATCRHRKPSCLGYGAVCYDPRFIGGDGVMFYFHGKKDNDFCLVSDNKFHINAHFIGKRPEGRTRDYTWVQSLGIMFDVHQLSIGVKTVATWNDEVDQLFIIYDGMDVEISQQEGALWTSPTGDVVIERTTKTNGAHVLINKLMDVSLSAVPITEQENRVHNYQITKEDCFAHLQMQFNFFNLGSKVNGILGQTYQPGFLNPVKRGVPMPIMGGDEKYLTSSLLSADCKVTQFDAAAVDASFLESDDSSYIDDLVSVPATCLSSGSSGITCRR